MKCEIGSNFWEYQTDHRRTRRLWWEEAPFQYKFYKSGRNATLAMCNLVEEREHRILLPAYLCETEVDPWREKGWEVSFYRTVPDFSIDVENLKAQVQRTTPSVVLLQTFYGFNANSSALRLCLRQLREQGIVVVEDITQSLLSTMHYEEADWYVASLRKFFAIPDGGVLIGRRKWTDGELYPGDPRIEKIAREAFALKEQYFQCMDPQVKEAFRTQFAALNEVLGINDRVEEISPLGRDIFASLDIDEIARKRRENYEYLYGKIEQIDALQLPCPAKCGETIPLFLPVYVKNEQLRNELRTFMAHKDIYCPIIWQKLQHYEIPYEETRSIYERILCIPIDQRYDQDDMERTAAALAEWAEAYK